MPSAAIRRSNNFVDLLVEQAKIYGDKTVFAFLEDGDNVSDTLSYTALVERAHATAATLSRKYPAGSRILLLYPSCIDYMVAFFGCLCAGMVAVPVFPPRGSKHNLRLEAISGDSGASVAMTTSRLLKQVEQALQASPILSSLEIICSDLIDIHEANVWQRPDVNGTTLAFLQYTSGSTGQPKGIMVSHGNLMQNESMIQAAFHSNSESVYITWAPIYHDMGLIGCMLHSFWLGATCYFMAPVSFLQRPARWLQAITRFRGTLTGGPNFAYQLCLDKIHDDARQSLDLSSLKVVFNGSEPVRHATMQRFGEVFASAGFKEQTWLPCYGMAESTLIITGGNNKQKPMVLFADKNMLGDRRVHPTETSSGVPLVGCGNNLPGQTIRIVEPSTGRLCPSDRIGEIWLAGPHIGGGYWQRSDATRETFHAYIAGTDQGPFLRTGDLGFMYNDELFVAGRIKDVMIVRGVNAYPQDVEAAVEDAAEAIHPAGSAAFAIEDSLGERVVVVAEVKRKFSRDIDKRTLVGMVRQKVLEQHDLVLGDVVLIRQGSLPKTSSGKVMRSQVRQLYQSGELAVLDTAALIKD